jgi:hypothetical protein
MNAPKRRHPKPSQAPGAGWSRPPKDDGADGIAAELEALVFLDGGRRWIDHALAGDIPIAEGASAARVLLTRAEQFAT